ncbi:MAG: hypothetical protein ACOYNF_14770 [Rhodoferax sp.]
MHAALTTIDELAHLPMDWDGYGALPIHPYTADNAATVIRRLLAHTTAPDITPNANGTLSLEWESSGGSAHLEIGMTRYSFYIKPNNSQTIYRDGMTNEIGVNLGLMVQALLLLAAS